VVYALGIRIHEMHATIISIFKTYLKIRILEAIKIDHLYLKIKGSVQKN